MKKFILSEILLLSQIEKKARRITFDLHRTIILGKNETGKSSLIKSIYAAFGASPARESEKWKQLNPILLVKFKVGDENYSILKDGRYFSVFDNRDRLIDTFDSVTTGLGPFIAQLFDFKIKLPNSDGIFITPPPAFLFLPFYIDQDIGWVKAWESFKGLQQIKAYKKPIIEYHTGLRPNEYYEMKGEVEKYEKAIQSLESERKLLQTILNKIREKLASIDFEISLDDFKVEVERLLMECQNLKTENDKIKVRVVELYNSKISLESQLTIAKHALNESHKDYEFAAIDVEDSVDCPTCGAHYENSFLERFEIAKDENRLAELLINLNRDLDELNGKLQKENEQLSKKSEELLRVEAVLEEKKGEITLRNLIENEGKKQLREVFQQNIDELYNGISKNYIEQKRMQERLKELEDKERKENIRSDYRRFMHGYLRQLRVAMSEDQYKDPTKAISMTGSTLPRALTAYYFSILQLIQKYSSCTFCPIIIDSPNQQAQDYDNIDKVFSFIRDNQPSDSQLILGLEELHGIDFGGKTILLDTVHSLLQKDEYEGSYRELVPFLERAWSGGKTGRLFMD